MHFHLIAGWNISLNLYYSIEHMLIDLYEYLLFPFSYLILFINEYTKGDSPYIKIESSKATYIVIS